MPTSTDSDTENPPYDEKIAMSRLQYVHLLNSTLTATERTICCTLEDYQKEDGVCGSTRSSTILEMVQP
ncbi:hypothetical protein AB3S75_012274 [Citrus x aurantiifolia]